MTCKNDIHVSEDGYLYNSEGIRLYTTKNRFLLANALYKAKGAVLPRERILSIVGNEFSDERSIDSTIKRLRKDINNKFGVSGKSVIGTSYLIGYYWRY